MCKRVDWNDQFVRLCLFSYSNKSENLLKSAREFLSDSVHAMRIDPMPLQL